MRKVRMNDATTPCLKCGAAMVVVKVQPAPDDPERELHMFRCEMCLETAFFRFPVRRTKQPARQT